MSASSKAAWEPEIVFFVLSAHQAEDAWAVSKYLQQRILLVPLNEATVSNLPLASLSDRLRVRHLVPNWLAPIRKEIFFARGLALIRRLTRRRPFPVFVLGNDVNVLEHSLIQFVRRRKAPSILVQDGFLDQRDQQWIVPGSRPLTRTVLWLSRKLGFGLSLNVAYGAGGCDVIAAYGHQTREVLIQRGVRPETISVTGAPRFDDLISTPAIARPAPTNKLVILALGVMFSFQKWSTVANDDKWLKSLNELSLRKPEWTIILRPHPTEPMELYEEKLSGLGESGLILDRARPIWEVLRSSDALIVTFPSTVVLEANLLGVPVVFLDLKLAIQENDYTIERGALTVSEPEDLVQVLERVTNASWQSDKRSRDREAFLNRFLGLQDGRGAQRIAQIIDCLYVDQGRKAGSKSEARFAIRKGIGGHLKEMVRGKKSGHPPTQS